MIVEEFKISASIIKIGAVNIQTDLTGCSPSLNFVLNYLLNFYLLSECLLT